MITELTGKFEQGQEATRKLSGVFHGIGAAQAAKAAQDR